LVITDTNDDLKFFGINNVQFSGGSAAVNWASFSFTLPATEGEFKLTGAGSYNNKPMMPQTQQATTALCMSKGDRPAGYLCKR
jgi:hypothetical protein